jgi:gentisate 1,2-dioxygenase
MTSSASDFYQRLSARNAAPLWEVLAGLVTPAPRPICEPALWRYTEMRELLMEAGDFISARDAERRVLVLENPKMSGMSRATDSLYAGLQLVLPGEIAPSHRHTASALRFVIESDAGYTVVDGEEVAMSRGDFVITPSWSWHDHGNLGTSPVIWLDVLDMHLVNLLACSFAERDEDEMQSQTHRASVNGQSPIVRYPHSQARATLAGLVADGAHPCHGVKMQYSNPAGGPAMNTIGTFIQLLPAGFRGQPYRATDSTLYCVVEGKGETRIGDQTFRWGPSDIFVAPSWFPVSHNAESEAVLFSASDRPVQQALGLWREEL